MKTITQVHSVTRLTSARVEGPMFDLPTAISSGAINEQQLISVLTEMCRCVLAAQQTQPALVPSSDEPPEIAIPIAATPVAV